MADTREEVVAEGLNEMTQQQLLDGLNLPLSNVKKFIDHLEYQDYRFEGWYELVAELRDVRDVFNTLIDAVNDEKTYFGRIKSQE
jgi:hypothetical protein